MPNKPEIYLSREYGENWNEIAYRQCDHRLGIKVEKTPVKIVNRVPAPYRTKPVRVLVMMVADLFHSGHIEFLKKAHKFGDEVVVGLFNDEDCVGYKRLPVMTLEERANVVGACCLVDEVIKGVPVVAQKEFLEKHNIDLVVHGDDFSSTKMQKYYKVPVEMGIMRTVPYTKGISTTEILGRIENRRTE